MDFIDQLKQFSARVFKMKDQITTEEATKTSLIMPFFQSILGFDVFNPNEFVPEFTADVGVKKGEKVDYAICIDGVRAILIEAKWCGAPLDKHDSQLFRYFGTTNAKFAILTNGVQYKFYTDLEAQNKMDLSPFLDVDILNIKESVATELKKFHKSSFNIDELATSATTLKYSNDIKNTFAAQLKSPSDDYIRFYLSQVYDGMKTQVIIDKFRPIVRDSLNNYISELMNERISSALKKEATRVEEEENVAIEAEQDDGSRIITTEEEIEAYYAIKAILAGTVDVARISFKDTKSYFSLLLDNSTWKWICRLRLDGSKKSLAIPDENKKELRFQIESPNDLFAYKAQLIEVVERLLE